MTDHAFNSELLPNDREYDESACFGLVWENSPCSELFEETLAETRPIRERLPYLHGFSKRCLDILLVLLAAPLAAILVGLAALAIKVTSRGPVFFIQERLGYNGLPFRCYKLRTMVEGAEKGSPQWATDDDPRVTGVGRCLRRTRLDELPQLFNVWRGEMSFVGPRPIRRHFAGMLAAQEPLYYVRFMAKPGVTGWDQVSHGYPNTIAGQLHKFRYDLHYLNNASFWFDLVILGKTIGVVLKLTGQ
jgi:lipopolysaccharide/colanic/teichoic acid biosynthesis glycosyltransferase